MTQGTPALTAALAAARANDLITLGQLIDWPLTGGGTLGRSIHNVLEQQRNEIVTSGLNELDAAAADPTMVADIADEVRQQLAATRDVRPAAPEVAEDMLRRIRFPQPPAGLDAAQLERLVALKSRAERVQQVLVLVTDDGEVPVALAPDTGLLVFVLG